MVNTTDICRIAISIGTLMTPVVQCSADDAREGVLRDSVR